MHKRAITLKLIQCLCAVLIVALDQLSKRWAMQYLWLKTVKPVCWGLNWYLVGNTGIAFGWLAQSYWWQHAVFLSIHAIIALWLLSFLWQVNGYPAVVYWAAACILGGSLGNALDRLRFQTVIDFIDLYWGIWHFPTFNLADFFITLGCVLWVLGEWSSAVRHPNSQ